MLYDPPRSLGRQYLSPIGEGSFSAPLRACGKIPVSSEFVDVRCDGSEAAERYRSWIQDGANFLDHSRGSTPFVLNDHRVVITSLTPGVLVVACIWHSGDKPSEQGIQRPYPFTLFGLIPAPRTRCTLAHLLGLAAPLWRQIEGLYPTVLACDDRMESSGRIRSASLAITQDPDAVLRDLLAGSASVDFGPWWARSGGGTVARDGFMCLLQQVHCDHWRSRGQRPDVWRLPIVPSDDLAMQAAVWLSWLDHNLKRPPTELGLLLPSQGANAYPWLRLVSRPIRTDDFVLLAPEKHHASERFPMTPTPTPRGSVHSAATAWNFSTLATLSKLAGFVVPRPRRRWYWLGAR